MKKSLNLIQIVMHSLETKLKEIQFIFITKHKLVERILTLKKNKNSKQGVKWRNVYASPPCTQYSHTHTTDYIHTYDED